MRLVRGLLSQQNMARNADRKNVAQDSTNYGARKISVTPASVKSSGGFYQDDLLPKSAKQVKEIRREMLGKMNLSLSRFYTREPAPQVPHKSATQNAANFFEAQSGPAAKAKGRVRMFFNKLSHGLTKSSEKPARPPKVNRINIQSRDSMEFKSRLIDETMWRHLTVAPLTESPMSNKVVHAACEQAFERVFNNLLDERNGPAFKSVTAFRNEVTVRFEAAWIKWQSQNPGQNV
jgi:hypothetical protein